MRNIWSCKSNIFIKSVIEAPKRLFALLVQKTRPFNLFSLYAFSKLIASFIEEFAISFIRKFIQHISCLSLEIFKMFCNTLIKYFIDSFLRCLSDENILLNHSNFFNESLNEKLHEMIKHLNHSPSFANLSVEINNCSIDASSS